MKSSDKQIFDYFSPGLDLYPEKLLTTNDYETIEKIKKTMDITNILKFREEVECVKKMEKKFGPASTPTQKINSIKPRLSASVLMLKCCWPNNSDTTKTPMELPSWIEPSRNFPRHSPSARTTNNNRM